MTSFPERFPVFPLPDCVLFPDVRLPLHIFEPRYRAMTRAALAGERVIGMMLLRPGVDAAPKDAPIFDVGCAGHVAECQELPDGRFNLVLAGERRFRVVGEERSEDPYRVAHAELLQDPPFETLDDGMRGVLTAARAQLESTMLRLAGGAAPNSVEALERRMSALDPVQLIHALSFGVDSAPLEKQGLLEARDPLARSHMLIRLLEFREAELRHPETPRNMN